MAVTPYFKDKIASDPYYRRKGETYIKKKVYTLPLNESFSAQTAPAQILSLVRTQCVVLLGLVAPVDHLDDPLAQDLHAARSPNNQITLTQSKWF